MNFKAYKFNFGQNWKGYSDRIISDDSLLAAKNSVSELLDKKDLSGLRFLDIGCGSGLFAVAAKTLNAREVIGIDCDPLCVDVSKKNAEKLLIDNSHVSFERISILDRDAVEALGKFDVVYAWGSLHHTGSMWEAIENAIERTASQGTIVLALYNKHITSRLWNLIKSIYVRSPGIVQNLIGLFFSVIIYVAKFLVTGKNPLNKQRGMNFWHDVIDWVGGYPYEYASREDVVSSLAKRGLSLVRMVPAEVPTGCNEFVFIKDKQGD